MKKHSDLNARLRDYLRQHGFRAGEQLPGERELAAALQVGRTALRPVLDALEAEGVLERRPQAGTFLRMVPPPHGLGAKVVLIAPFGTHPVPIEGSEEADCETDLIWLHQVVSAFERVAVGAHVQLEVQDQSAQMDDPCSIKHMARDAAQSGAQAVVMLHPLGSRCTISCALSLLHDKNIHPLIVSARTYPGMASQVYFDSAWGAYIATRHLLNLGHQRVGFIGAAEGHEWVHERLGGYRQALEAAEIEGERWIHLAKGEDERRVSPRDGAEAFAAWAQLTESSRPTGIVSANDIVALGFLKAARSAGVEIPKQLSLIGFDNSAGTLPAGLTTIERPTEALGEAVARVLLERLAEGPQAASVMHRLRPVLIERASAGAPPTGL